jgi:hypothetical protein
MNTYIVRNLTSSISVNLGDRYLVRVMNSFTDLPPRYTRSVGRPASENFLNASVVRTHMKQTCGKSIESLSRARLRRTQASTCFVGKGEGTKSAHLMVRNQYGDNHSSDRDGSGTDVPQCRCGSEWL